MEINFAYANYVSFFINLAAYVIHFLRSISIISFQDFILNLWNRNWMIIYDKSRVLQIAFDVKGS